MEFKGDACVQNYEKVMMEVMNLRGNIDEETKQKIADSDNYETMIEPRIYSFYQLNQLCCNIINNNSINDRVSKLES